MSMSINWVELKSQIRTLIKGDGIGSMVILALKVFVPYIVFVIAISILSFIINLPAVLFSKFLEDSAIVMAMTSICFILYLLVFVVMLMFLMIGYVNMIKNFVKTGNMNLSDVLFAFINDNKGLIIKTMGLVYLKACLFSLLCVVPGIIYSYKVMFVPFILTENPNMTAKDIERLSKEMMSGYAMEYFINGQLMLIGWYFVAALLACCCGISFGLYMVYLWSILAAFYVMRVQEYTN